MSKNILPANAESSIKKILGNNYHVSVEKKEDRTFSPNGWQYRRFGNSSAGTLKYSEIKKDCEFLEDLTKETRKDHQRSTPEYLYKKDDNTIIYVHIDISNTGKSKTYTFVTCTKISWKIKSIDFIYTFLFDFIS